MAGDRLERLARASVLGEARPKRVATAPDEGPPVSRGLALKAAAAFGLGLLLPAARPALGVAADSCTSACEAAARDDARFELDRCLAIEATYVPNWMPSLAVAHYVGCLAGAGSARLVRSRDCRDGAWTGDGSGTCGPDTSRPPRTPRTYDHYPPKPPAQRKKKPPKKPPKAPPGAKPPSCDDCPPSSFCDPCSSNALGFVCCYLPKKNGKSPCCA
jgi:hypothetical protein